MNNRTANIFDAWIINQHNRLKERIASSTMFDDDAFQETIPDHAGSLDDKGY